MPNAKCYPFPPFFRTGDFLATGFQLCGSNTFCSVLADLDFALLPAFPVADGFFVEVCLTGFSALGSNAGLLFTLDVAGAAGFGADWTGAPLGFASGVGTIL